jgi:ribosome-binding factor A
VRAIACAPDRVACVPISSEAMRAMSRRRPRRDLIGLAAEPGPEDGQDPKEFHRKPWDEPRQAGRKARQLCGQVKDALLGILAGCGDEVLQGLTVVSVEPAPHSGRLRVLTARTPGAGFSRAVAENHLLRAAGLLRAEVAAAVHRRYAPELAFEVIG